MVGEGGGLRGHDHVRKDQKLSVDRGGAVDVCDDGYLNIDERLQQAFALGPDLIAAER